MQEFYSLKSREEFWAWFATLNITDKIEAGTWVIQTVGEATKNE